VRVVDEAHALADSGFHQLVSSQVLGYDALTLLSHVSAQVPGVEFVTGVVPTYPRHPIVLAQQALTVNAVSGGRLTLGLGLSHRSLIEGIFGYSYARPAQHMRDYLEVLMPLLRREPVAVVDRSVRAFLPGPLGIDAAGPEVLVAALGPRMLELAGSITSGTITWMTGPRTLASHIVPAIAAAASAAGRPAPRVAAGLPVCVTDNPQASREQAAVQFAEYGTLPAYRAMLDREGVAGPGDVAIVGDEDSVIAQITRLFAIGATEFLAAPFGDREQRQRTRACLAAFALSTTSTGAVVP
jgi:F420-dependent oxidoreductase-like protein